MQFKESDAETIDLPNSSFTADLHLQEEKSDERLKNIEQEIGCPRCNDIITLTSDFDKIGYACQECDLLLIMK